jgi:hypothetical protein
MKTAQYGGQIRVAVSNKLRPRKAVPCSGCAADSSAPSRGFAMPVFLALAILGLLASVVVHGSTFFTDRLAMQHGTWLLHVGIFVVCIPAFVIQNRARAAAASTRSKGKKPAGLDDVAPYAPRWMNVLTAACFVYAFINFGTFFFLTRDGAPRVENGQYVLKQKSTTVRTLTEAEFHRFNRYETRGFSGHWLLFYSAAVAMLYSGIRQRRIEAAVAPMPPLRAAQKEGSPSYRLRPRPLLSPWAHQSLRVMLMMTGWMVGPVVTVLIINWFQPPGPGVRYNKLAGCALLCPFFGSAVLGAILPAALFSRYVAARCPACSGRAYYRSTPGRAYHCADCGHVHTLDPPPSAGRSSAAESGVD